MTIDVKIDRRSLIKGLAGVPVGLPLAAILADPLIARAVAAGLETVSIDTASGRSVSAALALPAETPAPAVLLVHEWWGLNDQIKSVAAELAKEGYVALAVDLYGEVADTPDEAKALMGAVKGDEARETLAAWIGWLRDHDKVGDKVATMGWCFGGGWALNASLAAPTDATIVYYGSVGPEFGGMSRDPAALKALDGPVLGHFATQDGWINQDMVGGFEARAKEAGVDFTTHWYEADHAFANPTQARYDEEDAKTSWQRTLEFLDKTIGA